VAASVVVPSWQLHSSWAVAASEEEVASPGLVASVAASLGLFGHRPIVLAVGRLVPVASVGGEAVEVFHALVVFAVGPDMAALAAHRPTALAGVALFLVHEDQAGQAAFAASVGRREPCAVRVTRLECHRIHQENARLLLEDVAVRVRQTVGFFLGPGPCVDRQSPCPVLLLQNLVRVQFHAPYCR
jgi:hypothetical protein